MFGLIRLERSVARHPQKVQVHRMEKHLCLWAILTDAVEMPIKNNGPEQEDKGVSPTKLFHVLLNAGDIGRIQHLDTGTLQSCGVFRLI